MSQREPADRERCQAETRQRAPFMQMGGPPVKVTRCSNKPVAIATETKPGEDGERGSMSLCASCIVIATRELGADFFTLEQLS